MTFNAVLAITIALAFSYYGFSCLFSNKLVKEFHRFGLTDEKRILTGILQLLGAIGILIGIYHANIGVMAAAGLSILMLLGFGVRIKIKDSFRESLPSFFFMILNVYLSYQFYLSI